MVVERANIANSFFRARAAFLEGAGYVWCLGWMAVLAWMLPGASSAQTGVSSGCEPVQSGHNIVLNELLAANIQGGPDLDFGAFSDWLELYNGERYCIDLGGAFLSDDASDREKWRIPDRTLIAPGGFALFWADGRDTTGQQHHLNFKLDQEGEAIWLSGPRGAVVDSLSYPEQLADFSFGRQPDGAADWFYLDAATPAGDNNALGYRQRQRAPALDVYPEGGFYPAGQTVVLQTGSARETIRYTLDGSIPDRRSQRYRGPIVLTATAVVRARAFAPDRLPGPMATHTYLVDESIALPVVSLTTEPANLWDSEIGIYVKGTNGTNRLPGEDLVANFFQDWERPCHIEYFDSAGARRFNLLAGIEVRGSSTRGFEQKSLSILARPRYGASRIEYQLFPSKNIQVFKRFILRNSGNDNDQTQFHDAMAQTLIEGRMDIDYQAYQPVVVFLNGAYWGILNAREKMDAYFPEANYGIEREAVEIAYYDFKRGLPYPEHYQNLLDFMKSHSERRDEHYQYIKSQLDLDAFINYYIFNLYIANRDWAITLFNSKGWRAQTESGRWRWLVFDTDGSFGRSARSAVTHNSVQERMNGFLIHNLSANSAFLDEFLQRFAAHLNTTFEPGRVVGIIDSLQANIAAEMPRHIARFGRPRSMELWREKVEVRRAFARRRPYYMRQHLMDYFSLRDTVRLTLQTVPASAGRIQVNGVDIPRQHATGIYFADLPIRLQARAKPGYQFAGWNDPAVGGADSLGVVLRADTVLTAFFREVADQQLMINEFMARNDSCCTDEHGDFDDWIEVYNPTAAPIDLGGQYITDDPTEPTQWQIPSGQPQRTTVAPGEFLVLWADGDRDQGPLHLPFTLDRGGGQIALVRAEAGRPVFVDSLSFVEQRADISLGRSFDGVEDWRLFAASTPGAPNAAPRPTAARAEAEVEDGHFAPPHFALYQNYPNPFNAATAIAYSLPAPARVVLSVYALSGQRLQVVDLGLQQAGVHRFQWDGGDLSSGLYLYRLQAGEYRQVKKMVLLK